MAKLQGMKEISKYVGYSATTILHFIRVMAFPATMLAGTWVSDTNLIDKWMLEKIEKDQTPGELKGRRR
jgi:hypothetical protein